MPLFRKKPVDYAALHLSALNAGNQHDRVLASRGLIAAGDASLHWVEQGLESSDPDLQADAAGVLVEMGPPDDWMPRLRVMARRKGEAADILADYFARLDAKPLPSADASGDYRTATERSYEEKLLLRNSWAPVTTTMFFARAPAAAAARALVTSVRGRYLLESTGKPLVARDVRGDSLEGLLQHLLPLDGGDTHKYLFLQTANPEWTAVFDSAFSVIGGEAGAALWVAMNGVECVTVSDSGDRRDYPNRHGSWAHRSITNFEPRAGERPDVHWTRTGRDERAWYFVEGNLRVGTASEPTARGGKKFTHEHLAELTSRFGLRPFDEDFYAPNGVGVLVTHPDPSTFRTYSLAQARGGSCTSEQPRTAPPAPRTRP